MRLTLTLSRTSLLTFICIALAWPQLASATVTARSGDSASIDSASGERFWVARRKKRKKKKRKGKASKAAAAKPKAAAPEPEPPKDAPVLDLTAAPPPEETPVLDLTSVGAGEDEAAKEQLLLGAEEEPTTKRKKKPKRSGGGFDFGGGVEIDMGGDGEFDFGIEEFDLGTVALDSPEHNRFDDAMGLMSDEEYEQASQEFRFFIDDDAFSAFAEESQYQLAKALYKMGFFDSALGWFKKILEQGSSHRRYRKSIEWLFFIARKTADETPVLAELARFRNVKFPGAYRDEYNFQLAKYLFKQAENFEVQRLRARELERGKKSKVADLNFEAIAEGGDFSGIDFGGGDFDFGGDEGGGFDFGGDGGDGGNSGGFDFGDSGGGGSGGGGFDFGGGGAMDFGAADSGGAAPASDEDAPTREDAPQNAKEAVRQGLEFVEQIDAEGKFGARAQYLKALLKFIDGDAQGAVQAFQEVVRTLNPRTAEFLEPRLREEAFLSLARVHYQFNQFDRSVYYYDLLPRDSESWLTALFEASWAYFRRGDFEKALGNLLTLHSPFFEREYFPESQLVKAIIYFEACRYDETRDMVDTFLGRFTKVMKEIGRIAGSNDAASQLYQRIRVTGGSASGDDLDEVTARVTRLALSDPSISRAKLVVEEIDEAIALWNGMSDDFRASRIGRELIDQLNAASQDRARAAGEVTRKVFERELYALRSLLAQALRVKLEVSRAERTVIEARMKGEATDEIIAAQPRIVVADDYLYWPYEGEYWRDELGTYELDFSMCRR